MFAIKPGSKSRAIETNNGGRTHIHRGGPQTTTKTITRRFAEMFRVPRVICSFLAAIGLALALTAGGAATPAAARPAQAAMPLGDMANNAASAVTKVAERSRSSRSRGRSSRSRGRSSRSRGRRDRGRSGDGRYYRRGHRHYRERDGIFFGFPLFEPDYYDSYSYGERCEYWHHRCVQNWGYGNPDYYGCLRYHGCL